MENRSLWLRLLTGGGAVLVLLFLILQVSSLGSEQVKTETVVGRTVQQTIKTTLFVVRDEQYIRNSFSGTIFPLVEDGSRVAKGDAVAAICARPSDALVLSQIEELRSDILRYENLNAQKNTNPAIEKLNKDIDTLFVGMLDVITAGKLEQLENSAGMLRDTLTSRCIAIEGPMDFTEKIAQLKKQLTALEAADLRVSTLTADHSGYFISHIDGYESTLDFSRVSGLNAAEIETAIASGAAMPDNNAMGKIVCDYNWYLAASIDSLEAARLKVGTVVGINTDASSQDALRVKVHSLNAGEGGKTAVVFVCNQMNKHLAGLRIQQAEIVIDEYNGLKINSEAVRVVDGVTGIYIVRGNVVSFRKIETLFAEEGYVIAKIVPNTAANRPHNAELFDEAIIKGKDLHEGKLVN